MKPCDRSSAAASTTHDSEKQHPPVAIAHDGHFSQPTKKTRNENKKMKRSKNFARNKKVYTSTYIAGATYEARHKFVNFYYIFFVAHVLTKQPYV